VSCEGGMACPQVVDGGMASNVEGSCKYLNKKSWTAEKGWSSSLGLGKGLTTHCENESLLRNIYRQSLGPGLILWYDLSNERGT
jgi:hypothetical protein